MKYRDLVPGVDRIQKGDEYEILLNHWVKFSDVVFGELLNHGESRCRRPIPDSPDEPEEQKEKEVEIKNAIIESATITGGDRGILTAWVHLDYGGLHQGFGGFGLYLPKSFKHHELLSHAGHFIWRVMEVAGVEDWDRLKGKTVRVKATHNGVEAIGHIVKDDWFNPAEDFKAAHP